MSRTSRAAARQLHLNVNILHSGFLPSAWRLPESDPWAFADVRHYIRVARIAEAGKLDAVFLADNAAIVDQIHFRPITALEPTVLLASIAAATTHIGVIGTASTSYNEPYNIARRFATLDHVSGRRAFGPQLRACRSARPHATLCARHRVHRGREGALEQLGR
jgi:hypothetical protein